MLYFVWVNNNRTSEASTVLFKFATIYRYLGADKEGLWVYLIELTERNASQLLDELKNVVRYCRVEEHMNVVAYED